MEVVSIFGVKHDAEFFKERTNVCIFKSESGPVVVHKEDLKEMFPNFKRTPAISPGSRELPSFDLDNSKKIGADVNGKRRARKIKVG